VNDPVAAQQLAGAAELEDIRLLRSSVSLEKIVSEGPFTFDLTLNPKVEHEPGADFFAVRIDFEIRVDLKQAPKDDTQTRVMDLEFEFAALYLLEELDGYEPSVEEFEAYADTSATLTLFPYAREYISDTVNRLGLPRLVLPPYRLPSPWHPDGHLEAGVEEGASSGES
jgi:preprotein translocase subunit SecB